MWEHIHSFQSPVSIQTLTNTPSLKNIYICSTKETRYSIIIHKAPLWVFSLCRQLNNFPLKNFCMSKQLQLLLRFILLSRIKCTLQEFYFHPLDINGIFSCFMRKLIAIYFAHCSRYEMELVQHI